MKQRNKSFITKQIQSKTKVNKGIKDSLQCIFIFLKVQKIQLHVEFTSLVFSYKHLIPQKFFLCVVILKYG